MYNASREVNTVVESSNLLSAPSHSLWHLIDGNGVKASPFFSLSIWFSQETTVQPALMTSMPTVPNALVVFTCVCIFVFIYARTPRQKEGGYDCDYLHALTVRACDDCV